jgi:protein-S-isoprenylcysteine O-methyltransferase Ste14
MIRSSVRQKIDHYLPKESFYAFHSICSGLLLASTVLLWQETDLSIFSAAEPYNYLLRTIEIISIIGLLWAIRSLTGFDPFGRKQISNYLNNRKIEAQIFVLRGPYKITRHPFYFFILLMIWSYPEMTTDRLLFAVAWTVWVTLGTILEEKDLVSEIGNEYVKYQANVPMLIPYKILYKIKN